MLKRGGPRCSRVTKKLWRDTKIQITMHAASGLQATLLHAITTRMLNTKLTTIVNRYHPDGSAVARHQRHGRERLDPARESSCSSERRRRPHRASVLSGERLDDRIGDRVGVLVKHEVAAVEI